MDEQQAKNLLEKYNAGQASDEEKAWLETWYLAHNQELPHGLSRKNIMQATDRIWARLEEPGHRGRIIPLLRYAAAASIVLGIGFGGYFLLHKPKPATQVAQNKNDIAPGGNTAILTLSNGQKIVLNGKQGKIASQAGRQVLVSAGGQITYAGQANSTALVYNTLTVPIGNRRDLTLPDGSQVSLDAGSSITYPVVFTKDRRIAMTGQAYIKVSHDPAHPFYTTVKGITIKDIGTEFNVNAYDDEPNVKTTLVQGSIQVNETILAPGEQAQVATNNIVVKKADLDAVTAWKDNDFYFDNQSLKSSMRQIARWYNVSVVYHNVDEKLQLFVDVSRSTNLSVVLKAIENTGKVKCSLEGHTIILSQPN
jgi:transmembrane sensor